MMLSCILIIVSFSVFQIYEKRKMAHHQYFLMMYHSFIQ